MTSTWLTVRRGNAPLILSIPHSGTKLLPEIESRLSSSWLARKDADWWVDQLYDFAAGLDATVVHTALSRTVIDVNRDPSGRSLYPGQATTELCPTTTFDGEPLYGEGQAPTAAEIADRRSRYFDPYHRALELEIARLQPMHPALVIYEAHSIRSKVPRLFDRVLPNFNIGTNAGRSCSEKLTAQVESVCAGKPFSSVTNGRFKGGYTTRHYGQPGTKLHAIQMELACRGYLREPETSCTPANWPVPYDADYAAPMRGVLAEILETCVEFATRRGD
ncbi:MAG: N-formylglutamate deformylase [Gammaproteobacteria bacterium]